VNKNNPGVCSFTAQTACWAEVCKLPSKGVFQLDMDVALTNILERMQILKEKGTQAGKEEIDDADQGFQSVLNIHAQ